MVNKTKNERLAQINGYIKNTLLEVLSIEFIDVGDTYLKATMPVTSKVHQPMGFLHGGASIALAETLGSYLSLICVDAEKYSVFGLELAANHVKSKREGKVTGIAKMRHKGRTTHLVMIDIVDEEGQLISAVKMSNIIIPKKK